MAVVPILGHLDRLPTNISLLVRELELSAKFQTEQIHFVTGMDPVGVFSSAAIGAQPAPTNNCSYFAQGVVKTNLGV
jgi:hypothetical protein